MRISKFDIVCLLVGLLGWGSCQYQPEFGTEPGSIHQPMNLAIEGYDHIDSAHVFFFRKLPDRDSLVFRQMVYDITNSPQRYDFVLPLGVYDVFVLGNVASEQIVMRPPYSRDSVWVSYRGDQTIPAIYFGIIQMNVGVDTLRPSALLLITAAVEVTLKNVPAGVDQIDVTLSNTGSGFNFLPGELDVPIQPELKASVYNTQADSSYVVEISSFPTIKKLGQSKLDIRCYDKNGKLVYSGQSATFLSQQGRRRVVTCTFKNTRSNRMKRWNDSGNENLNLFWQYGE